MVGLDERGVWLAVKGALHPRGRCGLPPDRGRFAAEQDMAVERADLETDDSVAVAERLEEPGQLGHACRRRAIAVEVAGLEGAVDEQLDEGCVAADDAV